jgi:RNA polymerase sigma-70 factor (ECF subfamily)
VTYCVLPAGSAGELHDRLRAFFEDDPRVEVIVEQRSRERRRGGSRRGGSRRGEDAASGIDLERREARAVAGRRVEERRGTLVPREPRPLPPELAARRERIRFFERLEPSTLEREDGDTARLVARIQAGETDLYGDLYQRYFDRVYSYLRLALRDADEAEDATQDVFMRVLQAIPRYERRDVPFRAWLFRIARNCAINRMRKRRRYIVEAPSELMGASERPDEASGQDRLRSIEDPELIALIEGLPLAQRQVLALRYMLDLPLQEIGAILDRKPDSVRQLHHRALESLRGCLEPRSTVAAGTQAERVRSVA